MTPNRLALHIGGRLAALALATAASSALAQGNMAQPGAVPSAMPPAVAPGTTAADVAPSPGLPGPASVDPAPGAHGPYAGHSEHGFYEVDARIDKMRERVAASLAGTAQKKAMAELASIKTEEKAQIARHGDLLDWARENLNHRLDVLVQAFPTLAG